MRHWIKGLAVALAMLAQPALADRLDLTGLLTDAEGNPVAGQVLRIVPGGETRPRARETQFRPDAGQVVTTNAQGRFSLRGETNVRTRRIELPDQPGVRHNSRLLELGFELELRGQPTLYWAEIDFTRDGPLVALQALRLTEGRFDAPLIAADGGWSLPDAPDEAPLPSIGAELEINRASDGAGGLWRVDITLRHDPDGGR